MKMSIRLCALLCALFSSCLLLPSAFPQGSLTPPDAPAPTMKTLDQVKAGAPIDPTQPGFAYPYAIDTSGSYYLTGNLTVSGGNAINVNANGVTLDLNGFTISSTASSASGNGIFLNNVRDVTILNGHIMGGVTYDGSSFSGGPGFLSGIIYAFPGTNPVNVRVSGVSVSGGTQTGIELGTEYSNVVDHCAIRTMGGQGIHAGVVSDSTAYQCGSNAINAVTATGCYGVTTASAIGIDSYTAVNCYGISVSGNGVDTLTASDCYGVSTSATGLNADTAHNCYGSSSSGRGLNANNATNCYGISPSSQGLYAASANNCYGQGAGAGLQALVASNCRGLSTNSVGLFASAIAINSYGASGTGTGLQAFIANSCYGQSTSGTPESVTLKYNMP
jgi:hypothetical protein